MEPGSFPLMIRGSTLVSKLRLALGDGVDSALLLSNGGALLSATSASYHQRALSAGNNNTNNGGNNVVDFSLSQECNMLVALVSNIWRSYASTQNGVPVEPALCAAWDHSHAHHGNVSGSSSSNARNQHHGGISGPPTDLEVLILELEVGKICCVGLGGRHVLVLHAAGGGVETGVMKMKAAQVGPELIETLRLPAQQQQQQYPGSGNVSSGQSSPTKSASLSG